MNNPMFIDEETIPMLDQDEDYDDYNTPNTSRIDETSFTPQKQHRPQNQDKKYVLECDRQSRPC